MNVCFVMAPGREELQDETDRVARSFTFGLILIALGLFVTFLVLLLG